MKRRTALALLGIAPLAGCNYIKAAVRGCPAPQMPPLDGIATTIRDASLNSKHVPTPVTISAVETGGSIDRVILALPGRGTGKAGDLSFWLRPYVAHMRRRGIAVVAVEGGETYWHPRKSEDRLGLVFDDLMPWVRNTYKNEKPMGVIGWSMGGYGAIAFAEEHPELFDRVCGVSPALWQTAAEQASAVPDAFDSVAEFNRYGAFARAEKLRGKHVRIVCGSKDPFYRNAVVFAALLKNHNISVETKFFEKGCHDGPSWQKTMSQDLAFVVG